MRVHMNNVVATRQYIRTVNGGIQTTVQLEIGTPTERSKGEGTEWYCPFNLIGAGEDTVRVAFGADAVQALYMAMIMAGAVISSSPYASELDWQDVSNFGLPLPTGSE